VADTISAVATCNGSSLGCNRIRNKYKDETHALLGASHEIAMPRVED